LIHNLSQIRERNFHFRIDIYNIFPMITEFVNYDQETIRAARYIGQSFIIILFHTNRLPITIRYPYEKSIMLEHFRGRI
jgi:NAD(P)H-quinone oxidoreductase subunit I